MKNILITGIPRSGTSLISSLIAKNCKSVTFSEPDWLKIVRLKSDNCSEFSKNLSSAIFNLRADINNRRPLKLKYNKDSLTIPSNYYLRSGANDLVIDKDEVDVVFDKSYGGNPFYIKSNAQFTSCLGALINSDQYKIYCIIRNPIACIMSWRSLNIPVSHGNMKVAEKYSDSYRNQTKGIESLIQKQVAIIDWHYHMYAKHAQDINIIKYEDLIYDAQSIIEHIINSKADEIPELQSKNKSTLYKIEEVDIIIEQLKKTGSFYKQFYPDLKH